MTKAFDPAPFVVNCILLLDDQQFLSVFEDRKQGFFHEKSFAHRSLTMPIVARSDSSIENPVVTDLLSVSVLGFWRKTLRSFSLR